MTKNRALAESSLSPIIAIVFQPAKSSTAGVRNRSKCYNQVSKPFLVSMKFSAR